MKAVLVLGMAGLILAGLYLLFGAITPIVRSWWRKSK